MHSSSKSQAFSLTFLLFLFLLPSVSESQLISSESRTLLEIQKHLQYPPTLRSWSNWTNFCYLPSSPSFKILCFNGHVTELTVTGNRTVKLPGRFSSDSLFTVLTKLSNLKTLSLVSLGISGPLPSQIIRLSSSLQSLNLSSNFISGNIPKEISSLKNLRSLVLANNLFNGSVPDLRGLSNLQELNLGGNKLGPEVVPSLASNLITISLKNNSFGSKIPEQIKKLNKLQSLDLSSNKFTGSIPRFLLSLPSLQNLSLAQNLLSGSLPNSSLCNSKLRILDVSRNLLTGKLPSCFSSKKQTVLLFTFNCLSINGSPSAKYQRPVTFCENEAKQAVAAVKSDTKDKERKEEDTGIELGLVIGIIIGVILVSAVLAGLVLVRMRKSRSKEEPLEANNVDQVTVCSNTTRSTTSKTVPDLRRVPQTMRSAVIGLSPYRVFSLEELEEATNNFDAENLCGEQLYKGCLREGIAVTVRCIKLKQKNSTQNLAQQMEVLSKLRHMHLVSVLGHCIGTYQDHHPYAGSTIFIVQEYISNGSLRDYLTDWRKKEVLKWPQRMSIAIGVARGIQFLHTGVAPGIFGNNLEIENVLLDETLTVKLSGYSIPLPSKVGAESPSNEDGEKEDVYQFGVILIQIITGKVIAAASSELGSLKLQLENSLRDEPSVLRSLADPCVRGTYAYESLRTTVEFAINCLCEDQRKRPSIEDVVWNLQYTIQVQQGWTSSENLGLGGSEL
ncbi:Contains similarity to a Receptor-like Protein Kinase 5 Precursor from Arabidopsis thaliana gi/1350783 and contains an Eukaryotic Protein Kinase PF/00069 domain and Leucine Rich PF/00560 repeats [Arabidopsis thaliana]|uniref:Probable LRR receptor-like serine/threonine-protein kinase At1g14390 n=1 Tax=Arabidopsis thaliana TaxID=3702 RepID=Y1143_ARATH|eukprot:NP_001319002.1 Leucine-rich repeat protein kinase family protein [Arabidopsis thaliana]